MLPNKDGSRKPPTIRDVAERAGVSTMTASRALNKKPLVSAKAQEAVERAMAELGYIPNISARALAGHPARRITLLHSDSMTSAYLGELLLGALHEAPPRHVHLIVEQYMPGISPDKLVAQILEANVAGVILPPPLCDWRELVDGLLAEDIAIVAIAPDREIPGVATVATDDCRAAYDMTRHLIDLGHTRIAFIRGNPRHRADMRRFQGFEDALRDHGVAVNEAWVVPGDFSYRSGLEAAEQLLALPDRPTAIFACNDDMAAAAITIAHQRRINVPAKLTICGFDDTPLASSIWPTLTTIRQPIREMSREAIALLSAQLFTGSTQLPVIHVKLDYHLIRRHSDAIPPYH